MTIKEKFNKILARNTEKRKKILYFTIGSIFCFPIGVVILGLFLMFLFSIPNDKETGSSWLPVVIILAFSGPMTGEVMMYNIRKSLKKTIVCPQCKKSLSYLVTDPNYTNKFSYFVLPEEFPPDVTHCPYCKFYLDSEADNDS